MANMQLLRSKIDSTGISVTFLAAAMGITRETLHNKLAGKSEFKASEITSLGALLHMDRAERDAIFFGD